MRTVLVVIPTLNEVHTIASVIESLRLDPPQDAHLRFVVADGGSSDGTVALVKSLAREQDDLHLMHNPQRLQGAGINRAVLTHGADAEVLIRADAHAGYPRGFCARLLESLDRSGADAVVVPMDSVGVGCFQQAVAWVSDTLVGSGGAAHRGGHRSGFVDHGHHAAFLTATFRRVGGYDTSLLNNEDGDFDCRQRAPSARVYLDADVRVTYHPRASVKSLARQYFGYGRGRSCTMRRHPHSARARQLAVPVHLVLLLAGLVAAPWWPGLLAWPLAYGAMLLATSLALTWRHRSLCGLAAGPAAAVMHTSWAVGFLVSCVRLPQRRWHPQSALPLGPPPALGGPG